MAGSPTVLHPVVTGLPLSGSDVNDNAYLIEQSFLQVSSSLVSGLVPTIGTGLSVNVSAGVAVTVAYLSLAGFVIGSLTPSTTNYLYLNANGTGAHNTTGTPPAGALLLGTCVTSGSAVTSVNTNRSSGRQAYVRPELRVPGGPGAGNPPSINLANWAAAAADSVPVFGVLPAGAVPAGSAAFTTAITDTVTDSATSIETSLVTLTHHSSLTPLAGFGTAVEFDGDDSANINRRMGKCSANWKVPTSGATVSQIELYAASAGSFVPCLIGDGTQLVTVPGTLSVAGHVLASTGPAVTAAAQAGAGGSPPAPVVGAGSTDSRGIISFGTGTSAGFGAMVRVTFATAFSAPPAIFLQALDDTLSGLTFTAGNRTNAHFDFYVHAAGIASSQPNTAFVFAYLCIG